MTLRPPTAAVIEGAAHAVTFSHPDQLAHVVRCFLEGRPVTADPTAKGGVRVFETPALDGGPSASQPTTREA